MLILLLFIIIAITYISYIVGRYNGANMMYDKFNEAFDNDNAEDLHELMSTIGEEPVNLEKEIDKLVTEDNLSLSEMIKGEDVQAVCPVCKAKLHLDLVGYPAMYFENYELLINELEYQKLDSIKCDCGKIHAVDDLVELLNDD